MRLPFAPNCADPPLAKLLQPWAAMIAQVLNIRRQVLNIRRQVLNIRRYVDEVGRRCPRARPSAIRLVAQSLVDHVKSLPPDDGTALAGQLREQWCEAAAADLFESVVNAIEVYFCAEDRQ